MPSYILGRLIATIPVVAVVAIVIFLLLRLAPGDPAAVIAGDGASVDDINRIRSQIGLDRPLIEQFWLWALQLFRGDLGTSIFVNLPVIDLIAQRVGPTVSLAATTLVLSVTVGIAFGTLAAARAGSPLDYGVMLLANVGFSAPVFVIGYVLVLIFALELDWLPVQGYRELAGGFGPYIVHLILPSVTLSFPYIALVSRITRTSVLDVLQQEYVLTAYAKGFGETKVIIGHVMRNAAVPIVTVIGIGVAWLISGVVVTESVFNIPGIGRLVVDAISRRDYPIIQGVILIFSGVYVLINLIVDLCCALFDPRIRY